MTITKFDQLFAEKIVKATLYSSFFMGILCLLFSKPYEGNIEYRQVLTIQGIQNDPNNQAAFLLVGVTISLYYLLNKRNSLPVFLFLLSTVIINSYSIFLSGSRGGLISMIAILIVISLLNENSYYLVSKYTLKNTIIIALFALCVYKIAEFLLLKSTFSRIFDFFSYSNGSNRLLIWDNVFGIIKSNLLIGGGWGAYWGYNDNFTAVHNTFLSIFSDGGIIALILFFVPIIFILIIAAKHKKVLPLLIILSGFMPSMFLDAINKRFFWNAIIIAFIIVNGEFITISNVKKSMDKVNNMIGIDMVGKEDAI